MYEQNAIITEISLILSMIFYGILAFIINSWFQDLCKRKWNLNLKNPKVTKIIAIITIVIPNIIHIILVLNSSRENEDISAAMRADNSIAWAHWSFLAVLFLILSIIIGIGKWNWQITAQTILTMYVFNFILQGIFYQIALFFLYPIGPFETLEYGFNIAYQINRSTFQYLTEILLIIIGIIALGFKSKRLKSRD